MEFYIILEKFIFKKFKLMLHFKLYQLSNHYINWNITIVQMG